NNFGMVNVQYFIGENRESSNLKLYDKVMQNMDKLPKGTMPPLVKPFDIDIDIPILTVAFYKIDDSPNKPEETIKLYKMIRDIQQDINALDNVSKTTLKGIKRPQFNVLIDLHKLSGYHISLGQVAKSIKSISSNAPQIDTETGTGHLVVFGVKNAIDDIDDLKELIVAQYMGSPIYLKNIAKVDYSYDIQNYRSAYITYQLGHEKKHDADVKEEEKDADAPVLFRNAGHQITMTVSKLKGTNAVTVAEGVLDSLQTHKAALEAEGIGYVITRNYGERANEAVNELVSHLLITIVIIAIVLVVALGWRESLIVTFTVPAILAITLFIAYLTGQTINRITLFAFLLSLGLLVDAAIIVIENIHRHMHEHDTPNHSKEEIMITATDEIGAPTNIATLAIILTMVPMAFVGGMMGEFMKPIPYNVPVALFASLLIAYVFTPYLANKMLKKPKMHHHRHHFQKETTRESNS
ncbi:MAG: AcrB/AcrD/AcrF family protein, partial [Sulfurimonas sp.]